MFENVPFFAHLHSKLAKSAIMTPKFFFIFIINMGMKKAELYADSNSLLRTSNIAP
jgi:hypothetical protein